MSVVDEVKARLDIVEVVSGYVTLRKSGRYFKAPCPFHTERTPSFIVNPERQAWHCFGACATGGDAISFVMRMEKLEFGDALRLLAQKAGVQLSQRRDAGQSETLHRINQVAARFYQDALASPQGKQALDYLRQRGLSEEVISTFQLGFSPRERDRLKSHLVALGFTSEQAVEAGLLNRGDDGSTWDFFRGRVMFPIHDRQGRIAGFGARSLDGSNPKYINTSRTPVFDKRGTLYGLHLAATAIKEKGLGVIVEGYMDVIGAHQHGYSNVVASMGTALTEQQVAQLKSLASSFVMALDPDAAGQEATWRDLVTSWQVFGREAVDSRQRQIGALYWREPLTLKVAALPQGKDPDEVIKESPQEWERLIQEAVPLMDYLFPVIASRFDLETSQGKAQAVETLFPVIAGMENPFEQERYFRKLAELLGVSVAALEASVGRPRRNGPGQRGRPRNGQTPRVSLSPLSASPDALEEYVLALLLAKPELKERAREFAPEHFRRSDYREVFTRWLSCSTIDALRDSLDASLHEQLANLTRKELAPVDRKEAEAALEQCLQRLESRHLQELQESLLACEDPSAPPPREIEQAIVNVNARLKELFSQRNRVV